MSGTPSTKRTGEYSSRTVTPDEKKDLWSYDKIVNEILSKNKNKTIERKWCDQCSTVYTASANKDKERMDKKPVCVFFQHKEMMIQESNQAMEFPEDVYKNNREQGARLACYKLWTMLEIGSLGRSRRRPLPICVEAHIKMMKPSATFKGYKEKDGEKEEDDSFSEDDTWEGTESPRRVYKKPKTTNGGKK